MTTAVIALKRGGDYETFRFNNADSAKKAVALLLALPDVTDAFTLPISDDAGRTTEEQKR